MIRISQPHTLGSLNPNDEFKFNLDDDVYYFVGNYGVGGFVCWNDTKKERKVLSPLSTEDYDKIIINKI